MAINHGGHRVHRESCFFSVSSAISVVFAIFRFIRNLNTDVNKESYAF